MSTTFIYYSEGVSEEKIILNNTDTFFCLKKHIISKLKENGNNNIDYVDLIMILDKPIRDFGKLILEPGFFPRTMDQCVLDKFNLENKEIKCEYIPVSDYKPTEINKEKEQFTDSLYRFNFDNEPGQTKKKKAFDLDLNSDSDFPSLC